MNKPCFTDVVVVGNGVSAYACVSRIAASGRRVTMVGSGLPYDRPPLSKRALTSGVLPVLTSAEQLREAGVAHMHGAVTSIDLDDRSIEILGEEGRVTRWAVRGPLVWATGLKYTRPPIPGLDADLNATDVGFSQLLPKLCEAGRRIVVVGAGLIGVETAATLAARHHVTVVDIAAAPLMRLHDPIPRLGAAALDHAGAEFIGGCQIEHAAIDASGGWRLATRGHGELWADVVVAATGVASTVPECLSQADGGSVWVDETLRVRGCEWLWACGDCATIRHPRFGDIGFPHWDWARRTGVHVAEGLLGEPRAFDQNPMWFSRIGALNLQEVGFGASAETWTDEYGLHVGRDADGAVAAVLLVNQPARMGEAIDILAAVSP